MQMVAGGNTGAAHIANGLPLVHLLAAADDVVGHVHINGGKAIAMVDGDIITGGVGIACNRHRATPGSNDGGPGGGCQVNALVILGGAGGGGFTEAEGAGYHPIAARNQPGASHGDIAASAAAGISAAAAIISGAIISAAVAAVGVTDGNTGCNGGGGNIGCHVGKPFFQLCLVVLLFLSGDFIQERLVLFFQVNLLLFQLLAFCNQLHNQVVCFLPLYIQLVLSIVQFRPCAFQLTLFGSKLLLGSFNPLGGITQLLQAARVGGGNLLYHVQSVKKVRKVFCLEKNLPIADGSFLLHGLNAGLAVGVQLIVAILCLIQFLLLVGNQDAVGADLLVDIDDFGVQQANLLVDHIFAGNNVGNVIGGLLILRLQIGNLVFDVLAVFLQCVNLLADFAGGGGSCPHGQNAENQGQQHDGSHYSGKNGNKLFAVLHVVSPSCVTGMPWG